MEEERYVLSSDFQDHEEALAKKLAELTGVSRRILDLAVHIRQGEIAQILEGDPRLDIALGITAAGTANEEMRALALEDERAVEALPALEASLDHVEKARAASSMDDAELRDRLETARAEGRTLDERLGQGDDGTGAEALEAFVEAMDLWRSARDGLQHQEEALAHGPEVLGLEHEIASLLDSLAAARARQGETELRFDLKGRIGRRARLLETGAATCESCGSVLDERRARAELEAWRGDLAKLEATAIDEGELRALLAEKQATLNARSRQVEGIEQARGALARAEQAARGLAPPEDARPLEALETAWQAEHSRTQLARAAERARAEAKREATATSLAELEARLDQTRSRGGALDREHARLTTEVEALRRRRRRAADLRVLAIAFKTLQEELRTRAATELATSLHAIHRALSVDDELETVTIDPARYQVLVTPRATGQELPASLSQGGGHRLLLGLAFRLALVKRLGPFPFVLLDEPTYGLDERHRAALLERISGLGLCEQLLIITHQPMGTAGGPRVHVVGQEEQAA